MKILVTGGAGFIGSSVIRYIINHTNDCIVNVDKLTYAGNLESLVEITDNPYYTFEQADICDFKTMAHLFYKHQPDAIMHLAAESHVDRSINSSAVFMETNIIGTYIMLETARHYWLQLDCARQSSFRFHHISTDEVYGDLLHPEDASTGQDLPLFIETMPYAPSSPYSASKASSDHLVRAWHRTYGLPTLITNCSNNYGPYQFPEKMIPLIIINALTGKLIPIYGNGRQIRDWLFVEDHAQALYKVLTEGKIGETYNIGGFNELKNIDVVNIICTILDESMVHKPAGINNFSDLITYVNDRPGHDLRYAINASKIKKDLKWTPLETFDSGIRKTIKWYLDNESWWKRVMNGAYVGEHHILTGS